MTGETVRDQVEEASILGLFEHGTDSQADVDVILVERARTGDEDAMTELYRRHERRAYNLALRTLGNPWDAADVAQETFIKAFKNLDSFKGEARFGTWLHRIVVNAAYDHFRRHRPEPMEAEIWTTYPVRRARGRGRIGARRCRSGHGRPVRPPPRTPSCT